MDQERLGDDDQLITTAIRRSPLAMVLTDPRLPDNPITYVNKAFEALTLYSRDYAVGRNCRFLQGPETEPEAIDRIREGLRAEEEFEITLTNHRADGTTFRNQLLLAPIYDPQGQLNGYFGLQRSVPVPDTDDQQATEDTSLQLLRELQHRVKNHLSMIVSMIRIQARREVTAESLKSISRRIEALSVLYDELLNTNDTGDSDRNLAAGAYLSRIASVVASLEPRSAIRLNVECDDISLPVDHAARLGLLLSEFVTNAFEHAFEGRETGAVDVRFTRLDDGTVRLTVQDDGNGIPEGYNWPFGAASIREQRDRAEHSGGRLDTTGHDRVPGVGGSIVTALTDSLGATLKVDGSGPGTRVTVDL
jgi:PAS domain S-box-containing protein